MSAKRGGRKPRNAAAPGDDAGGSRSGPPPGEGLAAATIPLSIRPEAPPGLHLVATPIGNARDVTLRALDLLAGADVVAAEDTRTARRLLTLHGIPLSGRRLVAYSDATAARARPGLMAALAEGASVALVSEAGTPLVSDPGWKLAREAREAGFPVHAAPGPSAALAALAVGGLPTDRFLFLGFAPPRAAARRAAFAAVADVEATLVLFESPRRAAETLADLAATLGPARPASLCRELTKRFEEVRRGTLESLAAGAAEDAPRGEVVILVGGAAPGAPEAPDLEARLEAALAGASLRDAVALVTRETGRPRREVYETALKVAERLANP